MASDRRIVAVVLPELVIEVARAFGGAAPLVVVRTADESFTEANITGATRISAVSAELVQIGVRPGDTVSSARMKESTVNVRVVRDAEVLRALEAVADVAIRFGATVARSPAEGGSLWSLPCVWVDTTGCAKLFGRTIEEGEARALVELEQAVRTMGHACAMAMATGPRIARCLATAMCFTSESKTPAAMPRILQVEPRREREILARLPLQVLPLSEADVRFFHKLGVQRAGDLAGISRASLGTRLGDRATPVFLLADGIDRAPLVRYEPPPVIEERVELDYGARSHDALLFVMKTLADRMSTRLVGRGLAATRFEITYTFDDAFVGGRGKRIERESLALVHPEQRSERIFAPLRAKIEAIKDQAPVLAVSLSAIRTAGHAGVSLGLLEGDVERQEKERAREHVFTELLAELGETNVGIMTVGHEWGLGDRFRAGALSEPQVRSHLAPRKQALKNKTKRGVGAGVGGVREGGCQLPTRLLSTPLSSDEITPQNVRRKDAPSLVRFLFRLEANAWWKAPQKSGKARERDLASDFAMVRLETKMACAEIQVQTDSQMRSEASRELGRESRRESGRASGRIDIVGWFD